MKNCMKWRHVARTREALDRDFREHEIEPMETDTTFEQLIRRTENTVSQLAADATTSTR